MTDLAERLKITRSRLTYAVTRLEKDGLVLRENCRWDKRGSIAALTDEGMTVLEGAAPGHVETVRSVLFDRLSPEQVGQLEEIFSTVTEGFQGDAANTTGDDVPWRRRSAKSCS